MLTYENEGDYLDIYIVECLILAKMIRFRSELKAPGRGWVE